MRRAQRGLAAVTAVLVVAVAASAAAVMLAQQSATLDQAMMVASRAQADQYAQAGVAWARAVLATDAASAGGVDSRAEGWAQPLVGLPVERALVSGAIADAQGRFNLNGLVGDGGHRDEAQYRVFQRLLAAVGLPGALADAVVDWIDVDDVPGPGGAEDAYYLSLAAPYRAANAPLVQVDELYRVKGFDAKAVEKLRPYVSALPARTAVNVNTADALVLGAVLDLAADRLAEPVKALAKHPLADAGALVQWVHALDPKAAPTGLDVKSRFFDVRVQVAQDDVQLGVEALVERTAGGAAPTAIIWQRPRY